jgi:hypothetical protein
MLEGARSERQEQDVQAQQAPQAQKAPQIEQTSPNQQALLSEQEHQAAHQPRQVQQTLQFQQPQQPQEVQADHHKMQQALANAAAEKLEQEAIAAQRKAQELREVAQRQADETARAHEALALQRKKAYADAQAKKAQDEMNAAWQRSQQEMYHWQQEQRLESERKANRKEELRNDRSALFRHYHEYIEHFPLLPGEQKSPYHVGLLANRHMPADKNCDLALAIQFAKDNWSLYMEYPRRIEEAVACQKEILAREKYARGEIDKEQLEAAEIKTFKWFP